MESKFRNRYEKHDAVASIAWGFVNFKTVNFSGSISSERHKPGIQGRISKSLNYAKGLIQINGNYFHLKYN